MGIQPTTSCKKPKGQAQPHTKLPKTAPATNSVPRAAKGTIPRALKLASTPIGQANVAQGHE